MSVHRERLFELALTRQAGAEQDPRPGLTWNRLCEPTVVLRSDLVVTAQPGQFPRRRQPVPLFLRGKLYADFHRNPDGALELVRRSLAKLVNTQQSRLERPEFFSDWSVDFKTYEGRAVFDWCFVDHNSTWPYVVVTRCMFQGDRELTTRYSAAFASKCAETLVGECMQEFLNENSPEQLDIRISDPIEKIRTFQIVFSAGGSANVIVAVRRLGEDNGMDTVMRCHKAFSDASKHMLTLEAAKHNERL